MSDDAEKLGFSVTEEINQACDEGVEAMKRFCEQRWLETFDFGPHMEPKSIFIEVEGEHKPLNVFGAYEELLDYHTRSSLILMVVDAQVQAMQESYANKEVKEEMSEAEKDKIGALLSMKSLAEMNVAATLRAAEFLWVIYKDHKVPQNATIN